MPNQDDEQLSRLYAAKVAAGLAYQKALERVAAGETVPHEHLALLVRRAREAHRRYHEQASTKWSWEPTS